MKNNNEATTELNLSDKIKVILTGNFIPGDPGVRYHRDGSGTPPTPPEFEIEKIECSDIAGLIELSDEYYSNKHRDTVSKLIQEFKQFTSDLFPNDIDPELTKALIDKIEKIEQRYKYSFGDSFFEDLSYKAADELENHKYDGIDDYYPED